MVVKCKYSFGDILYIKNDPEQRDYILVGIRAVPGFLIFELSYLGDTTEVYEFEVSETKDVLKTLLNNKDES